MFFESSTKSHRLIAHLDNRQIEFYGNLKELAQLDDRFFRCHRLYTHNQAHSIHTRNRVKSENGLWMIHRKSDIL